jgi:hypothetical protein
MGTPEGHQKSIFNTSKVKKERYIWDGIYPTKHKKIIETLNQPIEIKKISNKSMFSTSKVKKGRNSYRTEFEGSNQNPKKIIGASNLPIRRKIFPKKVCIVP